MTTDRERITHGEAMSKPQSEAYRGLRFKPVNVDAIPAASLIGMMSATIHAINANTGPCGPYPEMFDTIAQLAEELGHIAKRLIESERRHP